MIVYKNIKELITLEGAYHKDGRNLHPEDLSKINNAAIVVNNGKIEWVGSSKDLPFKKYDHELDCSELVITPEVVDSHTHLVFGGNRSFEYTLRLNGADYEEIAKAGGGILSTMKNTQEESEDTLFKTACKRIDRIHSYGVGTIEIKSGYDLSYEGEKIISKLIHKLKEKYHGKVNIINTFLAAHAVPKEYKSSTDYLDKIVLPLLDELASSKIIDIVDIFHEEGYFCTEDVHRLFKRCAQLNIPTKIHADEFNDNDGAKLACDYKSLSCDHLLNTSEKNIELLAKNNTVASLLPGTALFLGKDFPRARLFLEKGAKVAIASDYNPGSCHCDNLILIASLCAKTLGFNIAELWSAITLNASHSLGLNNQGALIVGMDAKFSFFKCESIDEITYNWGRNFATWI